MKNTRSRCRHCRQRRRDSSRGRRCTSSPRRMLPVATSTRSTRSSSTPRTRCPPVPRAACRGRSPSRLSLDRLRLRPMGSPMSLLLQSRRCLLTQGRGEERAMYRKAPRRSIPTYPPALRHGPQRRRRRHQRSWRAHRTMTRAGLPQSPESRLPKLVRAWMLQPIASSCGAAKDRRQRPSMAGACPPVDLSCAWNLAVPRLADGSGSTRPSGRSTRLSGTMDRVNGSGVSDRINEGLMPKRAWTLCLLGLVALGYGSACGGRSGLAVDVASGGQESENAATDAGITDAAPSFRPPPPVSEPPDSSVPPFASGGPPDSSVPPFTSGGPIPPPPPPGFGSPPPSPPYTPDGGCGPSILAYKPQDPTFQSCWSCVSPQCTTQVAACASECICNQATARALDCARGGDRSAFPCFGPGNPPLPGTPPDTLSTVSTCVLNAADSCGCPRTFGGLPAADASTGCSLGFSSGGLGGGGECAVNYTKTCGSTNYRAVCACPQANCVCYAGATSKVIPFAGCPYCPGIGANAAGPITANDLFVACGFPQ
jgi:hypothetical protein